MKTGSKVDPPFEETWAALEKCVEEGLVRSIGVSNFSPEKIESGILPKANIRPAVNQVGSIFLEQPTMILGLWSYGQLVVTLWCSCCGCSICCEAEHKQSCSCGLPCVMTAYQHAVLLL